MFWKSYVQIWSSSRLNSPYTHSPRKTERTRAANLQLKSVSFYVCHFHFLFLFLFLAMISCFYFVIVFPFIYVCMYVFFNIFFASFSNGTTYFSIRCTPFRILYRYACGRFLVCMMQCFWIGYLLLKFVFLCYFSKISSLYMYAKIVYVIVFDFVLFAFCKMARKIFFKISLLCFIAAIFHFVVVCVVMNCRFLVSYSLS